MSPRLRTHLYGCALLLVAGTSWSAARPRFEVREQAEAAYGARKFAECSRLWLELMDLGAGSEIDAPYGAACCRALDGRADEAFHWLNVAIDRGWEDLEQLEGDADLLSLHGDERWAKLLERVRAKLATFDSLLREQLIEMRKLDQDARASEDPALIAEVERKNRARFKEILASSGWPLRSRVGIAGAGAAWVMAQHADGELAFQKRCLELMRAAFEAKEADGALLAYLIDRVRLGEGKKQLYGTQFETKATGKMVPSPIEDESHVNSRRKALGLVPLAEYAAELRAVYARSED